MKKQNSKKNSKSKKGQASNELFDFENEIVIGITKIEEPKPKETKKKKKNKQKKQKKQQKKQEKELNKETKIKKSKPNKKVNIKTEKRKRRVISFFKWIFIITVTLGALLALMLSPLFNIRKISVEGNSKLLEEEIISSSKIQTGENLFLVNNNAAIKKIKENAYIEEVKIRKKLPDNLVIEVKERKATYAIKCNEIYMYINNQGYILEEAENAGGLPEITSYNTDVEQIKIGNRLNTEDLEILGIILKIMELANSNEIGNLITNIDIKNKNDIILKLDSEKKTVHLGKPSDIDTKMMYIKVILDEEKGIEGDIIIEGDITSEKVIFREKI